MDEFIRFACQNCQKSIKVAASTAGKHGHCPKCGAKIVVPPASTISTPQLSGVVQPQTPVASITSSLVPDSSAPRPIAVAELPTSPRRRIKKRYIILAFFVLLFVATVYPVFLTIVSTAGIAIAVGYLFVPQMRTFIENATGNAQSAFRKPAWIVLPICIVALMFAFRGLGMRSESVERQRTDIVEGLNLMNSARSAHARGEFSRALDLARDASLKLPFDHPRNSEAESLFKQYENDLGGEQAKEVDKMIVTAKAARDKGDIASAVATLAGAKDFFYAPNRTEAETLSKEIARAEDMKRLEAKAAIAKVKVSEMAQDVASLENDAGDGKGTPQASKDTFQRGTLGVAMGTLLQKFPALATTSPRQSKLADGIPQWTWRFTGDYKITEDNSAPLAIIVTGPENSLSRIESQVEFDSDGPSDQTTLRLFFAFVAFSHVSGEEVAHIFDRFRAAMDSKREYIELGDNRLRWLPGGKRGTTARLIFVLQPKSLSTKN